MQSHRALLIGVLLPAAFTHALYSALRGRSHMQHSWQYQRSFSYHDAPTPPTPPWMPGAPPVAPAAPCDAPGRTVRTFDVSAGRADRLELPAGITDLQVDGRSGLDHVELQATSCGAADLALTRDGDALRLESHDGMPAGLQVHVSVPLGMRTLVGGEEVGSFGHRPGPMRPRRFGRPR